MNVKSEYYVNCINQLLIGLKVPEIPRFMENLTPQNCFRLGEIYHKSIMEVCAKVDSLEAIIKEMEGKLKDD